MKIIISYENNNFLCKNNFLYRDCLERNDGPGHNQKSLKHNNFLCKNDLLYRDFAEKDDGPGHNQKSLILALS
jgi:hypothetical protein